MTPFQTFDDGMLDRAWQAGWDAADSIRPLTNPYPYESIQSEMWESGLAEHKAYKLGNDPD